MMIRAYCVYLSNALATSAPSEAKASVSCGRTYRLRFSLDSVFRAAKRVFCVQRRAVRVATHSCVATLDPFLKSFTRVVANFLFSRQIRTLFTPRDKTALIWRTSHFNFLASLDTEIRFFGEFFLQFSIFRRAWGPKLTILLITQFSAR